MKKLLLFLALACRLSAATTWYVDSSVGTSGNGLAWATAFKTIANITGVSSGDTVYFSGGSTGNSQTYDTTTAGPSGEWTVVNGVTYKIGQDSSHNGTAILDGAGGSHIFLPNWTNVTISGDAGDGARHFKVQNTLRAGVCDNWTNTRVTYVDFSLLPGPTGSGGILDFNPVISAEIDHCYFYGANTQLDHIIYGQNQTDDVWDNFKVHDNLIYIPYGAGGFGADGLQINGYGYSIYNNRIIGYYLAGYTGNQHQDGWQGSWGSKVKIYGNILQEIQNYALYMEPSVGGYTDGYIVNNICFKALSAGDQCIAVAATVLKPCTRITVANNITAGWPENNALTFRNPDTNPLVGAFISCKAYNNIDVNGINGPIIDSTIANGNNLRMTTAEATAAFTSYTIAGTSNDFRPLVTATSIVGQGFDLSSVFTVDAAGAARSAPWDIGAYKLISTPTLPGGPRARQLLISF